MTVAQWMDIWFIDYKKQACGNELIPKNPADNVKLPRNARKEMKVLTLDEQAKFIKIAKHH